MLICVCVCFPMVELIHVFIKRLYFFFGDLPLYFLLAIFL